MHVSSDGVDGWLADPDVGSFAHSLQTALDATDSYKQMGLSGREKLRVDFSADKWLGRWLEVLNAVLES